MQGSGNRMRAVVRIDIGHDHRTGTFRSGIIARQRHLQLPLLTRRDATAFG